MVRCQGYGMLWPLCTLAHIPRSRSRVDLLICTRLLELGVLQYSLIIIRHLCSYLHRKEMGE